MLACIWLAWWRTRLHESPHAAAHAAGGCSHYDSSARAAAQRERIGDVAQQQQQKSQRIWIWIGRFATCQHGILSHSDTAFPQLRAKGEKDGQSINDLEPP